MLALAILAAIVLLLVGGFGLFVKGLIWLFWIALILLILDLIFGVFSGRRSRL